MASFLYWGAQNWEWYSVCRQEHKGVESFPLPALLYSIASTAQHSWLSLLRRHWLVTPSTYCQPGLCRFCFLSAEQFSSLSVPACIASWGCSLPKTELCTCLWNSLVLSCPFLQPLEGFWKAAWQSRMCASPQHLHSQLLCGLLRVCSVLFHSTKDAEQDWFQYQSLRTPAATWFPAGLCTANPFPDHFPPIF